jgi:prepilin-type N-terminal cleavage/methylation domain-containing protein
MLKHLRKRRGFSLIELLIVVAVILVITALAVPKLLRSKMAANESSAGSSLRSLNSACVTYSSTWNGFPLQLSYMGPGMPYSSKAADLIDSVLVS